MPNLPRMINQDKESERVHWLWLLEYSEAFSKEI
jgi:hypothetical protein